MHFFFRDFKTLGVNQHLEFLDGLRMGYTILLYLSVWEVL